MKTFLLVASLLLTSCSLPAEQLIVFAKGDVLVLENGKAPSPPKDPAKRAFVQAVTTDLDHPTAFAPAIALVSPPEWGRTVPGANGRIEFHPAFRGGFLVRVRIQGLAPDHRYILTLNGNPKLDGNDRLADAVPNLPAERYLDFCTVTTDAHGAYQSTFAIALLSGPYDVRFYVKDTADFKIVLYHDYFKFSVE